MSDDPEKVGRGGQSGETQTNSSGYAVESALGSLELRYRERWLWTRNVNNFMKMLFAVVSCAIVVFLLVFVVLHEISARGIVAEPFSIPKDIVESGRDSTGVTKEFIDKLNDLVRGSERAAFRPGEQYRGDWGDDRKVEIPETGLSIMELERTLRRWLGHEKHMSGEIWRSDKDKKLKMIVRLDDGGVIECCDESDAVLDKTPESKATKDELDELLRRSAKKFLRIQQPFCYAAWLVQNNDAAGALDFVRPMRAEGPKSDRLLATQYYANALTMTGDNRRAMELSEAAVHDDPLDPGGYYVLIGAEIFLARDRRILSDSQKIDLLLRGNSRGLLPTAQKSMRAITREVMSDFQGDFSGAHSAAEDMSQYSWYDFDTYGDLMIANTLARDHDTLDADHVLKLHDVRGGGNWTDATALKKSIVTSLALPWFFVQADRQHWAAAADDLDKAERDTRAERDVSDLRHTFLWPWQAYAWAKLGRFQAAHRLLDLTPEDCTLCLEMRGRVAAEKRDSRSAADWFERAALDAPDVPFATTDWGEMLLRDGHLDAAIAKFESAHQKGPHFADPLEMWGEALIAKDRSDLALAKFEEAAKYAPNWGRLHLKWGEALSYLGRKDDAAKQFALARSLHD